MERKNIITNAQQETPNTPLTTEERENLLNKAIVNRNNEDIARFMSIGEATREYLIIHGKIQDLYNEVYDIVDKHHSEPYKVFKEYYSTHWNDLLANTRKIITKIIDEHLSEEAEAL
ncbi:MAG: hypothetical protein R3Y51_06130 [Rikenellaceae bacterium]